MSCDGVVRRLEDRVAVVLAEAVPVRTRCVAPVLRVLNSRAHVSLVGVVLAVAGGSAVTWVETTVLMTVEETLEALAKAKDIGYRQPGES